MRPSGDDVAVTKRERIDRDVLHRRAQVAVLSVWLRVTTSTTSWRQRLPATCPAGSRRIWLCSSGAVTLLDLACPAGAKALEYEGLRGCYLPEVTFPLGAVSPYVNAPTSPVAVRTVLLR